MNAFQLLQEVERNLDKITEQLLKEKSASYPDIVLLNERIKKFFFDYWQISREDEHANDILEAEHKRNRDKNMEDAWLKHGAELMNR